jgi:hypothetical protein
MLAIKRALDPRGMMNPGRYMPVPSTSTPPGLPKPYPLDYQEWAEAAAATVHPIMHKYISYQTGGVMLLQHRDYFCVLICTVVVIRNKGLLCVATSVFTVTTPEEAVFDWNWGCGRR